MSVSHRLFSVSFILCFAYFPSFTDFAGFTVFLIFPSFLDFPFFPFLLFIPFSANSLTKPASTYLRVSNPGNDYTQGYKADTSQTAGRRTTGCTANRNSLHRAGKCRAGGLEARIGEGTFGSSFFIGII
jgi:hypothetical protein